MSDPWMGLWLSAANGWAGAVRGSWTAELHRQQRAPANELVRHTMGLWTRAWMAPTADPKAKHRR